MTTEQLRNEWNHYTRQLAGGATSTATSVLLAPMTGGGSLVGLGLGPAKVHNARRKREIIEAGLRAKGTTHQTNKMDVIAPMMFTGAISGVTMGLAGPAANMVTGHAVGHGVDYAASYVALDAGASTRQIFEDQGEFKARICSGAVSYTWIPVPIGREPAWTSSGGIYISRS